MARKLYYILPVLLLTLVVCSCQTGPQARIEQNPAMYNRLSAKDKELAIAVLRAYNDWHIDQWCGGAPGRFIPLAIIFFMISRRLAPVNSLSSLGE